MNVRRDATATTVIAAAIIASCGFPQQERAEAIPDDQIPAALRHEIGATTTTLVATDVIAVWFIRDGTLERRVRPSEGPVTATAAIAELVVGPDERDEGTSLRTAIVDDVVAGVARDEALATVELSSRFRDIDPDDQLLAVAQMVMTLTDVAGIGEVGFAIDGTPIAVPLPDGQSTDEPVTRRQFVALVRSSGS